MGRATATVRADDGEGQGSAPAPPDAENAGDTANLGAEEQEEAGPAR